MRWRFLFLLGLTFAYFHQGSDPNQTSRLALVHAIVERGAVDITPEHALTLDKGKKGDRFFSDKAPGTALLVSPAYALMRAVDRIAGHDPANRGVQRARLHTLSFLAAGLPAVAAAWFVLQTLLLFGSSQRQAYGLAAAYALGTLVFPFATVLFGHVLAAALLAAAFYFVQKWRVAGTPIDLSRAILLGLLWGTSIIVEYPTGILVAIMGLYTMSLSPTVRGALRILGGSALGASAPFAAHMTFTAIAYGSMTALPYKYLVDPMWISNTSAGILGIGIPTKIGLWGALLSPYRGLFFLCPFLALVFAGFARWHASGTDRREMWTLCLLVGAYVVFDTSYYAWDGGGSTGSRHIIPALAFMVYAVGAFSRSSKRAAIVTFALVVPSVLVMYLCTAVVVEAPEASPYDGNPLYDLVVPAILRGELHQNFQDAYYARMRSDAGYNLGTLLGLSTWASLLVPPLAWVLAYLPDITSRRAHATA